MGSNEETIFSKNGEMKERIAESGIEEEKNLKKDKTEKKDRRRKEFRHERKAPKIKQKVKTRTRKELINTDNIDTASPLAGKVVTYDNNSSGEWHEFKPVIVCHCCRGEYSPARWEKHVGGASHNAWRKIKLQETGEVIIKVRHLLERDPSKTKQSKKQKGLKRKASENSRDISPVREPPNKQMNLGPSPTSSPIQCPLCNLRISLGYHDDPDVVMNNHFLKGCPRSNSALTKKKNRKPRKPTKIEMLLRQKTQKRNINSTIKTKTPILNSTLPIPSPPDSDEKDFTIYSTRTKDDDKVSEDELVPTEDENEPIIKDHYLEGYEDPLHHPSTNLLPNQQITTTISSPSLNNNDIHKSYTHVNHFTSFLKRNLEPKLKEVQWLGNPIKKTSRQEFYYGIRLDGIEYYVGQCARFESSREDGKPFLGRIASFFQENSRMLVECIWYYFPEDTNPVSKTDDPHEVYLSGVKDVNTVGCIVHPANVTSYAEYQRLLKLKEQEEEDDGIINSSTLKSNIDLENLFFSKLFYCEETKSFRPIEYDLFISLPVDQITVASLNPSSASPSSFSPSSMLNLPKDPSMEDLELQLKLEQCKVQYLQSQLQILQSTSVSSKLDHLISLVSKNPRFQSARKIQDILQQCKELLPQPKRKLPKNWPANIEYCSSLIWHHVPKDIRDQVYFDFNEDVEILPIPSESDHPARGQFGLFAKRFFKDKEIIGEYTGRVFARSNNEKTNQSSNTSGTLNQRYTIELKEFKDFSLDIDAAECGNETRFINDFRGIAKSANVQYHQLHYAGSWRILIITKRKVMKGEEFLVNYGAKYWENLLKNEENIGNEDLLSMKEEEEEQKS